MLRRLINTLINLPLVSSSVTRMLAEDPLHFGIQVARRTPSSLRDFLSCFPPKNLASLRGTLWALALDRSDLFSMSTPQFHESGKRLFRSPLAGALYERVQIERHSEQITPVSTSNKARLLWNHGHLTEAVSLAPRRLRERYMSQQRVLQPDFIPLFSSSPRRAKVHNVLQPRIPSSRDLKRISKSQIRSLHILTNSLPWTQSGYSLRSHNVLRGQITAGIDALAITRLAYPITVGKLWAGKTDTIDGVPYHRSLPWFLPRLEEDRLSRMTMALIKVIERAQPDVLHTTTPFTNGIPVYVAAQLLGIPWVYEMRGELENTWLAKYPRSMQADLQSSERYTLMRARETQMAVLADAVVVLSEVQRLSLIERGISAEKIHVIPNAVDEALLARPRDISHARDKLGLQTRFLVGCVSSLVDYEGLDTLLKAIAIRHTQGSDVQCAIVGDGVARASLMALAEKLGIEDSVYFPGRVGPDTAVTWYEALDIMIIPRKETSVTRAVTPMKGLQAMALGVPQIVSDLPALAEIGSHDGQGLAVPPEDPLALAQALERLESDPQLRHALGQRGREIAASRTWQAHGHVYARLYEKLVFKHK